MKKIKAIADRFAKNLHYYDYTDEIKEEKDDVNGTVVTKWKLLYEYTDIAECVRSKRTGNSVCVIFAKEKKQRTRARALLGALGLYDVRIDAKGRFIQGDTVIARETLYLNARTMAVLNDTTHGEAWNVMKAEQFVYGSK